MTLFRGRTVRMGLGGRSEVSLENLDLFGLELVVVGLEHFRVQVCVYLLLRGFPRVLIRREVSVWSFQRGKVVSLCVSSRRFHRSAFFSLYHGD